MILTGCSRNRGREEQLPVAETAFSAEVLINPALNVIAILKTGANPIWFEYTGSGPRQISSPAEAALADFTPWPHSRYTAGQLASEEELFFAVNRSGFMILSQGEESGSAVLSSCFDFYGWDPYTIASVFMFENKPGVLLYRDVFFGGALAPALEDQLIVLTENGLRSEPVPAFTMLPKEEGWEINSLRRGPDGRWYYRYTQTGFDEPQTAFFYADNLSETGHRSSQEDYRNSSRPGNADSIPAALKPLIDAFSALPENFVLRLLPDERTFALTPFLEEDFISLFGFYDAEKDIAFACGPDGQGFAIAHGEVFSFSLPPLPQGFVYTGAGLAGEIFAAAWEEQKDFYTGAAGLMVLNAGALGLIK